MTAKLAAHEVVTASVVGLGYELVDFEYSAQGLMRVFIDKAGGIGVEDCANVSNHLTRVFVVENIEFERLEVSSPGLDRPLKTLANYRQYIGRAAKIRLNTLVDGRKRFDGVIETVEVDTIVFGVVEDGGVVKAASLLQKTRQPKRATTSTKSIRIPFDKIDKARLIAEI